MFIKILYGYENINRITFVRLSKIEELEDMKLY